MLMQFYQAGRNEGNFDAGIEAANQKAFAAYLGADPTLVGIALAREAIVGMNERRILHSGPPIAWEQMCGPMQGAIIGAIIFEGWTKDQDTAQRLAASGEIAFAPCHHHGAVGPMAGITSPSMPVWVVRDPATGRQTFSNLNEGLGKVLRFGANEVYVRVAVIPATRSSGSSNVGPMPWTVWLGRA